MRWLGLAVVLVAVLAVSPAAADGIDKDGNATAESVEDAVRVTVVKAGGEYAVRVVSGGGSAARQGCTWSLLFVPDLADAPYGTSIGPPPDPDARFALLLCNGEIVRAIWVAPRDIVDLDAAAQTEAQRYVEEVLTPAISIGVNPSAKGLAGLRSWFWVDGFDGSVTAPPIVALGVTIDVRMSTGSVTWDFGDGTVERGDLGRAYPEESSVQHAHRDAGSYVVRADISLVPEFRVNGGPWFTLPNLTATASVTHEVQQRQAVVTET